MNSISAHPLRAEPHRQTPHRRCWHHSRPCAKSTRSQYRLSNPGRSAHWFG